MSNYYWPHSIEDAHIQVKLSEALDRITDQPPDDTISIFFWPNPQKVDPDTSTFHEQRYLPNGLLLTDTLDFSNKKRDFKVLDEIGGAGFVLTQTFTREDFTYDDHSIDEHSITVKAITANVAQGISRAIQIATQVIELAEQYPDRV